jgi:hypothetical protein
MTVPISRPAAAPFAGNDEHLAACFARADQLLKAHTVRWRATLAASKPAAHWGMVLIGEDEVAGYLESPFQAPGELPDGLAEALAPHWRRAEAFGSEVLAREAATPPEVDLRLARLAAAYGLGPLERDLLAVCLLVESDGRLRRLVGYLQDDATRRRPSVELLEQVLLPAGGSGELRGRLAAGPLRDAGLLVVEGDGEPVADRAVRLDDRIAEFLLGRDAFDARLDGVLERAAPAAGEPAEALAALDLDALAAALPAAGAVALLAGPYGSGRRAAAVRLAAAAGAPLLLADAAAARARPEGWARAVDLAFREAVLAGAALAWTGCERLLARPEDAPLWDRLIVAAERFPGLTFLVSEQPWEPVGCLRGKPFLRFDLPAPSYRERRRLWLAALPPATELVAGLDRGRLAEELANGFQLTGGQIADAVVSARGDALERDPAAPRLASSDLFAGCRRQAGRLLTGFARRIEPRPGLTFDQLVLPAANSRQLDDLRRRIRFRSKVTSELGFERRLPLGRGLVALFSGTSGTGKTLAAELLAGEQGVDLYKVDLSAVVSKYVGETEKNLDRVFGEAESANALLFFDEADALFGKRGEVREARDRWANLEINFLLQRIEEYPGVVVLTTNLQQNIDEGFLRRIHVIVEFPFPDVEARLAIWKGMFPAEVGRPDDGLLRMLAERFRLPGGSIKNVVVDAAHRAVADNGASRPALTGRHIALALCREYQKLGKPVTRSEFGEDLYPIYEAELA